MIDKIINIIKNLNLKDILQYNSPVIISFFIICIIVFILNNITRGKLNTLLFSNYRSSLLNPLTYFRMISHIFGHSDWNHLKRNFLYILLIGPMEV
jgi:GlpG protein